MVGLWWTPAATLLLVGASCTQTKSEAVNTSVSAWRSNRSHGTEAVVLELQSRLMGFADHNENRMS